MPIQIQNARILTPFSQQDGAVLITGGRIVDVSRTMDAPRGTRVIDAEGLYLVPGYIDTHVHAGGGYQVADGTAEAIAGLCEAHLEEGTTTLLPTIAPMPREQLLRAIDAVRSAEEGACRASIAGVHLQGPYLSPAFADASEKAYLTSPAEDDWQALLDRWPDGIRIMGITPELPGALKLADTLRERGIVASISHSAASYDQLLSAVAHGFSDVTNPYTHCAMLQKGEDAMTLGVSESAMAMDELTVQVVADGRRLPLTVLQIIFRCKGAENILLISDAHYASEEEAKAGQTPVTMAHLVRNMVAAGVSLRVALRMATVNPARRIGLDHCKGRIGPGYDADLLLLDDSLNVRFCMAKGRIIRSNLDTDA